MGPKPPPDPYVKSGFPRRPTSRRLLLPVPRLIGEGDVTTDNRTSSERAKDWLEVVAPLLLKWYKESNNVPHKSKKKSYPKSPGHPGKKKGKK